MTLLRAPTTSGLFLVWPPLSAQEEQDLIDQGFCQPLPGGSTLLAKHTPLETDAEDSSTPAGAFYWWLRARGKALYGAGFSYHDYDEYREPAEYQVFLYLGGGLRFSLHHRWRHESPAPPWENDDWPLSWEDPTFHRRFGEMLRLGCAVLRASQPPEELFAALQALAASLPERSFVALLHRAAAWLARSADYADDDLHEEDERVVVGAVCVDLLHLAYALRADWWRGAHNRERLNVPDEFFRDSPEEHAIHARGLTLTLWRALMPLVLEVYRALLPKPVDVFSVCRKYAPYGGEDFEGFVALLREAGPITVASLVMLCGHDSHSWESFVDDPFIQEHFSTYLAMYRQLAPERIEKRLRPAWRRLCQQQPEVAARLLAQDPSLQEL